MKTDLSNISELSAKGAYTLLLFVSKEVTLPIGKLGACNFPEGYYTYTGSAQGKGATNLKNRVARHAKKQKQKFWHIDYLLADQNVTIKAVVAAETSKKMECTINSYLNTMPDAQIPAKNFGASDCKNNCQSHLLYFPETKNSDALIQKLVSFLESSAGVLSVVTFD